MSGFVLSHSCSISVILLLSKASSVVGSDQHNILYSISGSAPVLEEDS